MFFSLLGAGFIGNVVPCSRPSEDRTIPLRTIAERTKLNVEDVEYLLMKSLSVSPCDDTEIHLSNRQVNRKLILSLSYFVFPFFDGRILFRGSANNVSS